MWCQNPPSGLPHSGRPLPPPPQQCSSVSTESWKNGQEKDGVIGMDMNTEFCCDQGPTACVNSTPHVTFSHRHWLKFGVQRTFHSIPSSCAHDVVVLTLCDSPFHFLLSTFPPVVLFILLVFSFFFHDVGDKYFAHSRYEDLGPLADPLAGYEPNDVHISETTELYIQESSGENGSLNSHDLEYDDYTIGMALSSPLFTQEREDAASRRRAYHSPDEGLSSSQSSSVGHRTGRPVVEAQFDSPISNVRENPRRSSENEQIRILLERQREQILADC